MGNFIDRTGKRFGKLVVIEKVQKPEGKNRKGVYWLCECDCGRQIEIRSDSLVRGSTKSCGCYKNDLQRLDYGESCATILFCSYKIKARNKGLEFLLNKKEFLEMTKMNCFYCDMPPSMIKKVKGHYGEYIYNGIDRIDSRKGYILENTVPCCWRCNEGKMTQSKKDFLDWVERVYNHSVKNRAA